MITLNTSKTLNIALKNTNLALAKVLESVSPKELETLSKGKDLRSIVDTLLQRTAQDSSTDKTLLKLLKNNPTLKELGSVSKSVKDLLQTLKSEKNPLPLEKQLGSFLSNIKDISETSLKAKIENSGLFLENKIKNLQTPQSALKNSLTELSTLLQETKLPNVKALNTQLKELLSSDLFKNISNEILHKGIKTDLATLTQMGNKVQKLLEHFSARIHSAVDKTIQPNDVLFSTESKNLLSKLNLLSKPQQLVNQTQIKEMFSQDLKAVLLKAHEEIKNSSSPNKVELLKQIDKLTLQIDYHQLLSQLSSATSLYIPYEWNALEDGNITIKSAKDDKFFTDIELNLKEYGALKLRLGMFEKNQLNINITANNKELKKMLQENLPDLKKQLFGVGVVPVSIRFLDEKETLSSAYEHSCENLNAGFEVKA